jgi:hypothetical protein
MRLQIVHRRFLPNPYVLNNHEHMHFAMLTSTVETALFLVPFKLILRLSHDGCDKHKIIALFGAACGQLMAC